MKLEHLYTQLLEELKIDGKTYGRIFHPLFYTYPYALRFEIGLPDLIDRENWDPYVQSAIDRAKELYHSFFETSDLVLVICDSTPDRELKEAFSKCKMRRIRSLAMSPFLDDAEDYDETYFYRYLYYGTADSMPGDLFLRKIVMGAVYGGNNYNYSSSVYFYNTTKSLLFHLYDDRGADLIAFCAEDLLPIYRMKSDMLLDYDREEMARKLGV